LKPWSKQHQPSIYGCTNDLKPGQKVKQSFIENIYSEGKLPKCIYYEFGLLFSFNPHVVVLSALV
jgi:hypothetical protein